MEYILLIAIVLFIALALADLLKLFVSTKSVAIWVITFILMLIPGCSWIALLILGWHYIIVPVGRFEEKQNKGQDTNKRRLSLKYLIPIYWPYIIAQMMFNDDTPDVKAI